MRHLLLALAVLPLAACGVAQSAADELKSRRETAAREASAVTVDIPRKAAPAAAAPAPEPATATAPAPEQAEPQPPTQADRFRREFSAAERFVRTGAPEQQDKYVLDQVTGCVYHENAQLQRDPVLDWSGKADCTYLDR